VVLIAGFDQPGDRDAAFTAMSGAAWLSAKVEKVEIGDDGWSTAWRAFFQPVVLRRLMVLTPWMEPPRDDRLAIVIDPGQAFGTGGHATTKLLLCAIETLADNGELPQEVLDVGTGSGVLAIAALLLGSKRALGVDIEEESVVAALENAQHNGLEGRLEARLGQASDIEGTYGLVLANIQLAVFEQCALDIARTVAPLGSALLSGLLCEQKEAALALFPGFTLESTLAEGEWIALHLRRT
jgi:ribosomal protein L11 methyltransferase